MIKRGHLQNFRLNCNLYNVVVGVVEMQKWKDAQSKELQAIPI
jgi:hypothetical protein